MSAQDDAVVEAVVDALMRTERFTVYETARVAILAYQKATADARDEVIEMCRETVARAAWKHVGDDAYSQGMDAGALHQINVCLEALDALKSLPPGEKK